MRKIYFLLLAIVCAATASNAQLTGTKNIPGDYASLAAAITDLNTQGVGAGGVTLNLLAANAQTAPAGGYAITATGTLANQITITGNGNTITAPNPQTAGQLNDALFKIIGGDYITIQGFTLLENAANTTTTAASNNMTEWGVALLYASTTDGAQNNKIQNNTIDLDRTYQNTFGIYSNSTHSATAVTSSATATTSAGGNSGLTILGNTITDVNIGIVVVGPTAAADNNDGLTIGTVGNGNSITNYGTTGTFSGYVNVSGTVNGILVRNTKNYTISYNIVTSSAGGTTAGTLRGIYVPSSTNAPTGTIVNAINNNTVSVRSGVLAGTLQGIIVESSTVSATSTLSISTNNITNTTHTIAGASGAITLISNAAIALTTNINDNTFTNLTVNTTGSVTFISNNWTNLAGGVKNVNGNSIVTGFNKTGAGGTVTLFTDNGSDPAGCINNSNNNNFSNITVTGATTIAGWGNTNGGSPTKTVTGNTFSNWTGGTSAITGLVVSFSGSSTVSGNLVSNISSAGAITGISSPSGALENFTQNTVHTLSSTGASVVTGMLNSGGTTKVFARNKIYNLESNNAGGSVNGILVSSGTTVTVQNNLIGDLRTPAANAAIPLVGLNVTGGTTVNAYYNTVWLNGTSSGALFGSSSISASTSVALTLRNNIFVNTSTAAGVTGFTSAYRRSTTTLTSYANASNNNLFYAGTPSVSNLIYYDGTNSDQTLAAYKARVTARDAASVTENPPFLSTTGSSANFLHISTVIATQVESAAVTVAGITDDVDGDVRNVSTPDIGADEGNFILLDLTGPGISYTPLSNTLCAASRTLSAVITDGSGVNTTAGTKPRIWFKKSTNANALPGTNDNTTDGWKYAEASNAASPFTLTIDPALIFGGVAPGDIVQYFVVAQDNAVTPNVGINSGTFTGTPASVALGAGNFPIGGSINSYTVINGGLSGAVTIGAAGTYPSLTGAGGLFAAINSSGLTGNLTVVLLDAIQTENGVNALNSISYGCSGTASILIAPGAGVGVTITGSNANAILKLNGADNVTINGLNTGGSSLLVTNTNATGLSELWIGSASASDGATNISILNTNFAGLTNTGTVGGIIIGSGTTVGIPAESPNNNITIQGCSFIRQQNGIYAAGNASAFDQNMVINQNNFGSVTAADQLTFRGLSVQNAQNVTISNNTIAGVVSSTTSSATTTGISVFGLIAGGNIYNNKISDIKQTNTTGWGSNGIGLFATSTASALNVYNNFVSDVASQGFAGNSSSDNGYGIMVGSGGGYNIDFNTVLMNTEQTSATGRPAAINFASGLPNGSVNLRNNILASTQTIGSDRWSILCQSANTIFSVIDNNDYVAGGPNLGFIGVNRATLTDIQTGFGTNTKSISFVPVFVSATNLHLATTAGANWCLNAAGIPVAGITTDIDSDTRNLTKPDIGADEFTATGLVITAPLSCPTGATADLTAAAVTAGSIGGLSFTYFTDADATIPVPTPTAVGVGTYYIKATNGTCSLVLPVVVAAQPLPTAFIVTGGGGYCAGGAGVAVGLSGSESGVNYQLFLGASPVGGPVGGTGVAISFGLQTVAGTYTVVATNTTTTCTNPMTGSATVSINPLPSINNTITQPTTCVSADGAIDITPSGTPGPYTYSWSTIGGSGVVNGQQDQTGLTVGQYTVIVTDQGTGCQQTAVFSLGGPGGCSVCPTIPAISTNPSGATCFGTPVTITASGLVSMGVTYGITFVESASPLADPYAGGTIIGTVPNGSLTSAGTVASITTSSLTAGLHHIYAILSPVPSDPLCRPSALVDLVIGEVPTVNPVANQVICNTGSTTAVTFSGAVAGTTYNWVNNTPSIGLGASGSGNIASFIATNAGTAPVTATVTVTPVKVTPGPLTVQNFSYTGAVQTWTVPAGVTSIRITAKGAQGGSISEGGLQPGGKGAQMAGDFAVTPGTVLQLIVGGKGNNDQYTSGGGGGSGVNNSGTPLIVAGGGAGIDFQQPAYPGIDAVTTNNGVDGQSNVNGGTAGNDGGDNIYSVTNISRGGRGWNAGNSGSFGQNGTSSNTTTTNGTWGLGGGGGSVGPGWCNCGAGGGGYSGGGAGNINSSGGGGGSFNAGTSQANIAGSNTGDGAISIAFSGSPATCTGTPATFTITVNPTPTVNAVANQTVCNNSSTTAISFAGAVTGTVYNWTNNTTSIGLAASGSGNIASFVATNTTNAPVTATITVTPSYTNAGTTCTGTPRTFTITVNPTPTVNVIANQTLCNNSSTTAVTFSGFVPGTVYNWTNNTTSIGLAANGTGNIASFVATNTTNAPVTATITVTPSYTNGAVTCNGTPRTFTITVNPTPTVNAVTNQTLCAGTATTAINFSGFVPGTVYNWTNNTPSIGLAANGTGNIASFTAINAGLVPVTATITVTPSYTNGAVTCNGTPTTFTITVNPAPTVTCPANITVNAAAGTCGAVVTYAATVTGTPAPTVTYSIPSGSTFPVGLTTVTVTATSACGVATCSFTVRVNDVQLPVITTQPVSKGFCSGTNATFTVVATNAASYQWQQWNGSAWVNVAGGTGATLTVNNVTISMSTNTFRVIVTGPCGSTVTSNAATLTVFNPPTVYILASPPSILPNQTATLSAIVNNGLGSFVWSYNGAVIPGSTGFSIGPLFATSAGTYKVVYTDPNGCVATSADQTLTAIVSDVVLIYPNPNFGQFHVRYFNAANEKATINVYNALGQRIYQKEFTTAAPYTELDIDLGFKANGIYTVEVVDGSGTIRGAKRILVNMK